MEKTRTEKMETEEIEKELSKLFELTFQLEDELNSLDE